MQGAHGVNEKFAASSSKGKSRTKAHTVAENKVAERS